MTWPEFRLGDVVTLRSGGTPRKNEPRFWDGDIPWLSSKDLTEQRIYDAPVRVTEIGAHNGTRLMPGNTVMFVVRGMSLASEFRVSITRRPCAFNQDLKAVECSDKVLPDFLFYALHSQREKIKGQAGEASHGTKKLETHTVENIKLKLPDIGSQERVIETASSYDDLIENNRRRIALLEEAARMLYREWFVHFRFPGHEHVRISDGLPEGWERRRLSEIANIFRGRSYRSSELVETDGQPFVNLKCINRFGGFRASGLKWLRGEHKPHHRVVPGDIVIAVTDMTRDAMIVAQAARVPKTVGEEAVFSMDLVKALPRLEVERNWLYGMFRFSAFSAEVREEATGATVLHLRPKHVEAWKAILPPVMLRKLYAEHVQEMFVQIDNLEIQIEKLAEARDLLLPRLMNGEIAV